MYEDQQYQDQEQPQKRHSAAKAAVAQQKPRDAQGKFLSGAELQQYRQMQQAQQLAAERSRMNSLLGKGGQVQPQQQSFTPQQVQGEDKFRSLLRANGAGGGRSNSSMQEAPADKWDTLLGKKKSNIRW